MSRANLAQHVADSRIAVDERLRAGMVCRERKEEQARDLLRGGVLRVEGGSITLQAACQFPGLWQRSGAYMGSPKNERLLIQVRCRSERSSTDDYQMHGDEVRP